VLPFGFLDRPLSNFSRENMRNQLPSLIAAAFIMGFSPFIHAQTYPPNYRQPQPQPYSQYMPLSPNLQYDADGDQAMARYREDQILCNDDPDSASRMQCKRDAKAEYDKAIGAARTRMAGAGYPASAQPATVQPACLDCGQVTAVYQTEKKGEGSALGVLAGALAGGVLGHQVGGGRGKDVATAAGAVGGAFAGNAIEKNVNAQKVWIVTVTYPNGTKANFEFANAPAFRVGDTVRNSGQTIVIS
jgi:outer membrane lipoprotein SlyB